MKPFLAVLTTVFALVLAGCGGSSGGSGSDTSEIVPRSAFVYGEAVVDPEDGQEEAVHSIVGKFPGEGPPEQRLEKLISDALRESDEGKLDYAKDVKPWLGDTIGFFASSPPAGAQRGAEMPGAVIIATEDEEKARDAIEKSGGSDLKERKYKDVDYWLDAADDGDLQAGGIVDGFAVLGTEAGFKAAVDASKGESLADADRYKTATGDVEEERVGLFYADIQGALSAIGGIQQEAAVPLAALSGPIQQLFGDRPIVATAKAEKDGVVIDSTLAAKGGLLSLFGSGTKLLAELPADSWVAVGQPDVGKYMSQLVDTFAGFVGGREQLASQVRAQTGLDLDRDILGWIGDLALFVQGTGPDSIGGGGVIETTDPSASKRALAGLRRVIAQDGTATVRDVPGGFKVEDPETPAGVFFLQKGERVVIAYGEDAAEAAAAGGGGLGAAPAFVRAAQKLGDGYEPSTYIAADRILEVARNFGAKEAELAKAEPYLKVFDHMVGGTKSEGDKIESRLRLGLK